MTDHRDDAHESEDRLAEIMAAYVAEFEAGHPPDRDALLAAHPELAAELATFFDDHDRLLRLARPLRAVACAALAEAVPAPGGPAPGRLDEAPTSTARNGSSAREFGDYELIDEIARGGMGVVYRARQRGLNRVVALKMILAGGFATPEDVRRFRAEAEAVADLDHPGIVPIHEVGEHRGQPYFSMKLIDGGSLAARLADFSDPRAAARLVAEVARAVHHAHQRGILHRDLKPSNVLLDADGRPHVVDFGLARRVDAGPELTLSGAVVGSPPYMSPEQASGSKKAISTATDVHGLGAVLYALLSGKPPFQADSVPETLDLARTATPAPPLGLGRRADRDLQTICLKCLEKEPARRYASAEAVADDLERWLRGEPIAARPVGRAERAWRWCRRNPVVAALSATVAALLVAAVIGLAVSRALIVRQRDVAQERLALARATVDDMYTQVATKWLAQQPRLEPAQKEFLLKALAAYERFAREDEGDSPALRRELALALQRAGEIRLKLGEFKAAEPDLRRALAEQEVLVSRFPSVPDYRRDLATTLVSLALLLQTTGRPGESIPTYRKAVDLQTRLAEELPGDSALRRTLVRSTLDLGRAMMIEGVGDVKPVFRGVLKQSRALVRDRPDEPENWLMLSRALIWMGDVSQDLDLTRESLEVLEKLARDFAGEPNYRLFLASTYSDYGSRLTKHGRSKEAIDASRRAVDLSEELVRDFPSRPLHRYLLVVALSNRGELLGLNGQQREAIEVAERARKVGKELVAEHPSVPDYLQALGYAHETLGDLRAMTGRFDEADASFARASAIFDKQVADDPDRAEAREELGAMYSKRVALLTIRPARDAEVAGRAIRLAEQGVARCPKNRHAWRALGRARYHAGDWKGALDALEKARTIDSREDCALWLLLALTHGRLGDREQARNWSDKAATWMKQHPEPDWSLEPLRDEAAGGCGLDDETAVRVPGSRGP